jgi:hypothetical protein
MGIWFTLCAGGVIPEAHAEAPPQDVVEEILGILHDRGLVDGAEYDRLTSEYAASQQGRERRLPQLSFSGDFRLRHDSMWFNEDAFGNRIDDRYRARYRFRLGARAKVNEKVSFHLRLVSGFGDRRTANQTLGDGPDDGFFDSDGLFIDRAYVRLSPFENEPFPGGSIMLEAGRVPNPYVGKIGKDFMIWDPDIVLGGASLKLGAKVSEETKLYTNTGYYIIEENSSSKDPHMFAAQAGLATKLADQVEVGGRVSGFFFDSLNGTVNSMGVFCPDSDDPTSTDFRDSSGQPFMCRAASLGNILGGLTGDPLGGDMTAGELRGYVKWERSEVWPLTLYGTVAQNFDAESVPGASKEDTAWGFGIELGEKNQFAQLGAGYFHIEANAFPALFIDSDLFDGKTNRRGFVVYGARSIWKNTDFKLTFTSSDEIDDGPVFNESVANADRYRLQTDVVFNF